MVTRSASRSPRRVGRIAVTSLRDSPSRRDTWWRFVPVPADGCHASRTSARRRRPDRLVTVSVDRVVAARALSRLEVDEAGLDSLDRRFLKALIENYGGGPVGMDTLAAAIAEARDAVEDVIEPYLLQQGFIQRTPRGRVACAKAYAHLGLTAPPQPAGQAGLFGK